MPTDPEPISGVEHLDAYLRERTTGREQEAIRIALASDNPAGAQAILDEANRLNESGQPRT